MSLIDPIKLIIFLEYCNAGLNEIIWCRADCSGYSLRTFVIVLQRSLGSKKIKSSLSLTWHTIGPSLHFREVGLRKLFSLLLIIDEHIHVGLYTQSIA